MKGNHNHVIGSKVMRCFAEFLYVKCMGPAGCCVENDGVFVIIVQFCWVLH